MINYEKNFLAFSKLCNETYLIIEENIFFKHLTEINFVGNLRNGHRYMRGVSQAHFLTGTDTDISKF